jgi:hypothetical protein
MNYETNPDGSLMFKTNKEEKPIVRYGEELKSEPVNKTDELEDKKAAIERRRQEELKDYNTINFEELKDSKFKYRLKNNKGIVLHKSEIRYSGYNNQLEFVNTKDIGKWLSKWYPTEDYQNPNISDPDILFRVDFSQFKEQLKKFYSGDGIKFLEEFEKLINAKYDTELAALEGKTEEIVETDISRKQKITEQETGCAPNVNTKVEGKSYKASKTSDVPVISKNSLDDFELQ